MSIQWSNSLIIEIAERRCIFVMGAGVSAGCISENGEKTPPDWEALLRGLLGAFADGAEKTIVEEMLVEKQYLDAAQIIKDKITAADFRDYIVNEFIRPKYTPSTIHRVLHEIDPKIVLTTNFDNVYENYCMSVSSDQGYNVCKYYENHALNDIRSTARVILKAHGCVADASKIVLTTWLLPSLRNIHIIG